MGSGHRRLSGDGFHQIDGRLHARGRFGHPLCNIAGTSCAFRSKDGTESANQRLLGKTRQAPCSAHFQSFDHDTPDGLIEVCRQDQGGNSGAQARCGGASAAVVHNRATRRKYGGVIHRFHHFDVTQSCGIAAICCSRVNQRSLAQLSTSCADDFEQFGGRLNRYAAKAKEDWRPPCGNPCRDLRVGVSLQFHRQCADIRAYGHATRGTRSVAPQHHFGLATTSAAEPTRLRVRRADGVHSDDRHSTDTAAGHTHVWVAAPDVCHPDGKSPTPKPISPLLVKDRDPAGKRRSPIRRRRRFVLDAWDAGSVWVAFVIGLMSSGPPLDGLPFLLAIVASSRADIGTTSSVLAAFIVQPSSSGCSGLSRLFSSGIWRHRSEPEHYSVWCMTGRWRTVPASLRLSSLCLGCPCWSEA